MRFSMRSKRAVVLGCGPAGLFAAHALIQNGWGVEIYSNRKKSHMFGAQYLHAPIPGLTPEDAEPILIDYKLKGDVEGYRSKVYGVNQVATSVELLGKQHEAWDIRAAYDRAWNLYGEQVNHAEISPEFLGIQQFPAVNPVVLQVQRFDLVVNSIPLPSLCFRKEYHHFHSVGIWAYGDAPERGQYVPYRPAEATVECNGDPDTGWYRAANVYGHVTVEWPSNRKPPLPGIASVTKPLYSSCDCYTTDYPTKFVAVGRYGAWHKGILSHHAYTTAAAL